MFAKKEKPLTKSELVNYIGPVFQNLKGGLTEKIDSVERRLTDKIDAVNSQLTEKIDTVNSQLTGKINSLDGKVNSVESRLIDKINWQGTLMEEMNKKIDVALELAETTTQNDISIKEHSANIQNLETQVGAIKLVLKVPSY